VLDARCALAESPVWSPVEQALYWVDIPVGKLHRWSPATQATASWQLPGPVGSIGLRRQGGLVVALKSGIHLFDPDRGGLDLVHQPEPDLPTNRLNDGKVSPDGRFWVGSMSEDPQRPPVAGLYRLDPDGRCHTMLQGLRVSNGLAWSPDGRTLYHADTRALTVWQHDHDPATGALSNQRVFVTMQAEWGRPDGAAVDSEGCYWRLVSHIDLPVSHPTMPCFGGPGLDMLFVTSLRDGVPAQVLEKTPQAGGIFAIGVAVPGLPTNFYAG
jgi:sugar lactone lactonase YvrE